MDIHPGPGPGTVWYLHAAPWHAPAQLIPNTKCTRVLVFQKMVFQKAQLDNIVAYFLFFFAGAYAKPFGRYARSMSFCPRGGE